MSKYIVGLLPTATEDELKNVAQTFEQQGGKILHQHTLFKGFTGELSDTKVNALESNPLVEGIEADSKVSIQ